MKRKTTLAALLAVAAAAPAIVAPRLVTPAFADDAAGGGAAGGTGLTGVAATDERAEYPDVPRGHWAYEALDRLSKAGIIEGMPNGTYAGGKPMTRYEFAVAIARLLDRIGAIRPDGTVDLSGILRRLDELERRPIPPDLTGRVEALERRPIPDITRAEVNDLIAALRREFADELSRLGVRVSQLEDRVTNLENRVPAPPRLTITPSLLHRAGAANYINNEVEDDDLAFDDDGGGRVVGVEGVGLLPFFGGNFAIPAGFEDADVEFGGDNDTGGDKKFSYTDFELRLTDRVTDRLSVNAAIRSISGTDEDPWLIGYDTDDDEDFQGLYGGFHVREANAVASLGGRRFLGASGFNLILGRQRTKVAQGLLYDNDFSPTDQFHGQFNLGPVQVNAFIGTNNNNTATAGVNPYINAGSAYYFGGTFGQNPGFNAALGIGDPDAANSGAGVGFPSGAVGAGPFPDREAEVGDPGVYRDDNEALVRAGFNLFRIGGNPVGFGASYQFSGVGDQRGYGLDLTVPLFNRTVGFEWVRQVEYFNGADADGDAFNITLPLFRMRFLDLDLAYGRADDEFEFFLSSAANPFARTYGEALFDRPLALGAPMINGDGDAGDPIFMAAKQVWDVRGTLRLIRWLPLDFRYYRAEGTDDRDLGDVWTVGSTVNITPGIDLEWKYGRYEPEGDIDGINYFRVGANVGF